MVTKWPNSIYAECNRGVFEAWLLRHDADGYKGIAYTDGTEIVLTREFKKTDADALTEFAEQYGCEIK